MQKIHIENFGPIKQADIEIKDVLLLIGEQASGKSTISKLIYFFKSLRTDLFEVIYENPILDINRIRQILSNKIWDKFYNFFGSTRHLSNFKIKYSYSETKFLELSLHPNKHLKSFFSPEVLGDFIGEARALINEINALSKRKNTYELIAFESSKYQYLNQLNQIINNIFEDDRSSLFIPAGRNITVTYSDQFKLDFYAELKGQSVMMNTNRKDKPQSVDMYLMIDFLKRIENIRDRFSREDFISLISNKKESGNVINEDLLKITQTKIEMILKGHYRYDNFGEAIVYDREKNSYVHLSNASSGQQEVIRILQDIFLALLDQEKVFRVIEEPEAHLYPVAQKHLLEIIALMINATKSQVVITTHSPYMLSIFNNLLFASKVVTTNATVKENVSEVIDESVWIDASKCQAYALKGGKCHSIVDAETGLIGENYLDEISEELGASFDELYHIHKRTFK